MRLLNKNTLDYFFNAIQQLYNKELLSKWKTLSRNNGDMFYKFNSHAVSVM